LRFTILAGPGSEPGEARSRAAGVVTVDGPRDVAAAAWAASGSHVLLLAPGARPMAGAFSGLSTVGEHVGVLGGATHAAGTRLFGWMLAPSICGPLPFELVAVEAPAHEAGADAAVRGSIDVVAPGMMLIDRRLLLEPLPFDPLAAAVELCARARAAGREVICRPSFACSAPALGLDDRGRVSALRAIVEQRPELIGRRRTAGTRLTVVERERRLEGGRRVRVRTPVPPLCVVIHGAGAELAARRARDLAPHTTVRIATDPVAALRAEMRVRGDRYVLLAGAGTVPDAEQFVSLVETIESAPSVAIAAPDAAALDGRCALLALARLPQHVVPHGATLAEALATLTAATSALRRAVRAPGYVVPQPPAQPERRATFVFLAGSSPEIMRMTLDAVVPAVRADDELVAVCAASAETTQRILSAYPQARIATDAGDPLLGAELNRALGAAERELVVVVADDVLVQPATFDRLRDAFERVAALGAAFPAVPGASGGEGVTDVNYADLAQLQSLAERRASERARRIEPIDSAVTPVFVVARDALDAVGGIDPALGPTRRGITELIAKLRAAGYGVVRCDDALVHRFDPVLSHSAAAVAGLQQSVAAADPAKIAAGFDPATRVPFGDGETQSPRAVDGAHARLQAIAVPVGTVAELEHAAVFLGAAAAAFGADDPVRVHLVLDGDVAPADAVARVRPVLAASGRPFEATVAVRIERVADLVAWRTAGEAADQRIVVASGHERAAFDGLRSIGTRSLRDLLEPVLR
jgi:hypothetical protein